MLKTKKRVPAYYGGGYMNPDQKQFNSYMTSGSGSEDFANYMKSTMKSNSRNMNKSMASGAASGFQSGGAGGAFLGAIGGGIFGGLNQKKISIKDFYNQYAIGLQKQREEMNLLRDQTKGVLQNYDLQGNENVTSFAKGGSVKGINVDSQNVQDLGGGLKLFKGASHENGGIPIDTDFDNVQDAEVEGEEVFEEGKDRIYSDRLSPNSQTMDQLYSTFGVKSKGTYADVAKKIGKLKDSSMMKTGTALSKTTNEMMNQRYDEALNMLFQDQSSNNKQNTNMKNYAKGGTIRKNNVPMYGDGYPSFYDTQRKRNFNTVGDERSGLDVKELEDFILGLGKEEEAAYMKPAIKANKNLQAYNTMGKAGDFLSANGANITGQLANYMSYKANKKAINKMELRPKVALSPTPRFTYTDQSYAPKNELQQMKATGLASIKNSSLQNKSATSAKLIAETMKANNAINASESQRREGARANYDQLLNRNNLYNSGYLNQANMLELENYNDRVGFGLDNRNALAQGVIGGIQSKRMSDNDMIKAMLVAEGQGSTGVYDRMIANNPRLASKYKLAYGGKLRKKKTLTY